VHEPTFSTWQKSCIKKGKSTIKNELSSQTETLGSSSSTNSAGDTKCTQQGLSSPSDSAVNIPHRLSSSILFKLLSSPNENKYLENGLSSPNEIKYSEKGLSTPVYDKFLPLGSSSPLNHKLLPQELGIILKNENASLTRINKGLILKNIYLRNETTKLNVKINLMIEKNYNIDKLNKIINKKLCKLKADNSRLEMQNDALYKRNFAISNENDSLQSENYDLLWEIMLLKDKSATLQVEINYCN